MDISRDINSYDFIIEHAKACASDMDIIISEERIEAGYLKLCMTVRGVSYQPQKHCSIALSRGLAAIDNYLLKDLHTFYETYVLGLKAHHAELTKTTTKYPTVKELEKITREASVGY